MLAAGQRSDGPTFPGLIRCLPTDQFTERRRSKAAFRPAVSCDSKYDRLRNEIFVVALPLTRPTFGQTSVREFQLVGSREKERFRENFLRSRVYSTVTLLREATFSVSP